MIGANASTQMREVGRRLRRALYRVVGASAAPRQFGEGSSRAAPTWYLTDLHDAWVNPDYDDPRPPYVPLVLNRVPPGPWKPRRSR